MSAPGDINTAPPPSSFDDNADFYEESRWQKISRRLKEEPLIPLGCLLTCWALIEATRSIRKGDKHRTNRMFRRRIYAQGFTILAMVLGSMYWSSDRNKRNEYNELLEDKRKKEKHEAWLRELEVRAEEEEEYKRARDRKMEQKVAEQLARREGNLKALDGKAGKNFGPENDSVGPIKSVLEEEERRGGPILRAAQSLWRNQKS